VPLSRLACFRTGKLDSNAAVSGGAFPFFTCSRETLRTNTYAFDTECVLLAGNNANGNYPIKYFRGKFDAYQRTYVIQARDPGLIDARYLYYALSLQLELMRSFSTGASTKFLTLGILNNMEIPVPTLPTQRKIAAILGAYDDLLANGNRRIEILEELAHRMHRRLFVGEPCRAERAEAAAGSVPSDSMSVALGDICTLRRTPITPDDESLPLLDLARIARQTLAVDSIGEARQLTTSRIRFEKGDVLFGAIRPYLHKVSLAPFAGVTNTSVLVLRAVDESLSWLLPVVLSSTEAVQWADHHAVGTKMPVIKWPVLRTMPLLLRGDKTLERFNQAVAPMLASIQQSYSVRSRLTQARDMLLPRLISGEIDMRHLDINTPELAA